MGRTKLSLEDIIREKPDLEYNELYRYILGELEKGKLSPVAASGLNGKKPALYNCYWRQEKEKNYDKVFEELLYKLNPSLNIDYYLKHPESYKRDFEMIGRISDYLTSKRGRLKYAETVNERSFEIFFREKYMGLEGGEKLLKRLGLSHDKLNCYRASEPMAYYSHHKKSPQNILIIENKDTFYSMRRYLTEGHNEIMGLSIGTLIYGSGKQIHKSFEDYVNVVEPYFGDRSNRVFYFGDLDYEGIGIYERLAENYRPADILLFVRAYEKMLNKAEAMGFDLLPLTKEGQNRNIGNLFMGQFSEKYQEKFKVILESEKYIPQEIINAGDLYNDLGAVQK